MSLKVGTTNSTSTFDIKILALGFVVRCQANAIKWDTLVMCQRQENFSEAALQHVSCACRRDMTYILLKRH